MRELEERQIKDEDYSPGYSLTPDVLDALEQNPDLSFPYGGFNYRLIVRENSGADMPRYSAYVMTEALNEEHKLVGYKICGAVTELAALKGINLSFGEEAYKLLEKQRSMY